METSKRLHAVLKITVTLSLMAASLFNLRAVNKFASDVMQVYLFIVNYKHIWRSLMFFMVALEYELCIARNFMENEFSLSSQKHTTVGVLKSSCCERFWTLPGNRL